MINPREAQPFLDPAPWRRRFFLRPPHARTTLERRTVFSSASDLDFKVDKTPSQHRAEWKTTKYVVGIIKMWLRIRFSLASGPAGHGEPYCQILTVSCDYRPLAPQIHGEFITRGRSDRVTTLHQFVQLPPDNRIDFCNAGNNFRKKGSQSVVVAF